MSLMRGALKLHSDAASGRHAPENKTNRDELFHVNSDIAKGSVEVCAKYCRAHVVAVIVNHSIFFLAVMGEVAKEKYFTRMATDRVTTLGYLFGELCERNAREI